MVNKKVLAFFFLFLIPSLSLHAYWVWSPEQGKFVNPEGAVQDSADEIYEHAMELYRERDFKDAIEQLEEILKKHRSARIAPEAQYRLGTIFEEQGDYWKAFHAYKNLIESYPQSERINEVIEREFRIGNLFLSGKKAKLMGLEILPSLARAAEIFEHIIAQAPYSGYGDQAQYRLGLTYKKMGRLNDALDAFQTLIDNYPQSALSAEARFQLAETSYVRSDATIRDQRALDDAYDQAERFLARYPDSTASEKAAKIRQEIDEKNAEKNYRIGAYYEKTKYLSSALIYFRDVAARYPHTQWGAKAQQRIQALEDPAAFLSKEEEKVQSEIRILEEQYAAVSKEDKFERDRLKRQIERVRNKEKALERNKKDSLQSRHEDIKRRKSELKQKFARLDKKKKLLEANPSEDLQSAIDRWYASLEQEREELAQEEARLGSWRDSLGMPKKDYLDMLPFIGEGPTEIERVRQVDAKKLFKVSDEKRTLLEEKELLYKQYGEVSALLGDLGVKRWNVDSDELAFEKLILEGGEEVKSHQEELRVRREEIIKVERQIEDKTAVYEERYGRSALKAIVTVPANVVKTSGVLVGKGLKESFGLLNPFDGKEDLKDRSLQELNEMRMHSKEKVTAQRNLVETLAGALDQELALREQKRLLASLEREEKSDLWQLRKTIKRLEKDIRSRYEEIGDRHDHKKDLVRELDDVLKVHGQESGGVSRAGRTLTAPFRFVARGTKAFLFGGEPKDVRLTKEASHLRGSGATNIRALELKEEIELQGLLIEVKHDEIEQLSKELEIAKAQASLLEGVKFRSSIVKIPYEFIGEAIDGAKKLIPKKDRDEMLIDRLNKETVRQEQYRADLDKIENEIRLRGTKVVESHQSFLPTEESKEQVAAEPAAGVDEEQKKAEAEALRAEIEKMNALLANRRADFQKQKLALEKEFKALDTESRSEMEDKAWTKVSKDLARQEDKLSDELNGIGKDLVRIIEKEGELEEEESEILEKRIHKIDHAMKNITSRAMTQDLLSERERLESRLSQLDNRRSFLAKELERFQLETSTPNP